MSGESLRVMIGARLLDLHLGLERRQFLERLPAVVEDMAAQRLEPAGRTDAGATAAPAVLADAHAAFLDHRVGHLRPAPAESGNVGAHDLFHPGTFPRGVRDMSNRGVRATIPMCFHEEQIKKRTIAIHSLM